tara:strand:+ start:1582 stop:1815 length:234 start_codon:yes stop_codon:yes gene_type:complete
MDISVLRNVLSHIEQVDKKVYLDQIVDSNYAIIDDRLAYDTQEKAEEVAEDLGCSGYHTHDFEGQTWYMPCETHTAK